MVLAFPSMPPHYCKLSPIPTSPMTIGAQDSLQQLQGILRIRGRERRKRHRRRREYTFGLCLFR
ncbi:hypothetical protein HanXRQr2_Chr14g0632331 [Helianthus annuus]|uniref:Uncharacterized protein n=1 Tax=Helianthus annuus TaxID=4232 RepID=A0A9K3E713_HELAN|nr:hypothetical protein HanXRQr2_Chr14g0632331 [Helianthus annuus]KAJ0839412.1 hypothetical protein HanPSC8_Chr14g0606501 [Helianthus annuus]